MTVGDHSHGADGQSAASASGPTGLRCCDLPTHSMAVLGVDFSSAPSRRKPITVAHARWVAAQVLEVQSLEAVDSLAGFEALIARPGPWIGGFDFPFGLPRELVEQLNWPREWPALVRHFASQPRPALREQLIRFCAQRPAGAKFAHRRTDRPAGSSPSMKWVNPPVAWMFHAGAPRLLDAGVDLPGLHAGDPSRVALEAYPGMLARALCKGSYKSDDPARQDAARQAARARIVAALAEGANPMGIRVRWSQGLRNRIAEEPRGDWLDAVLCAVQAAWALAQGPGYGLPERIDGLEGWIIGAPATTG